eukprot:CAMPEP_0119400226 /NCGR_PEP_ID=MMETSP1334-20130426/141755_1 /TAXON_ID=127549 /ORGANISM="Calcidiscus leptoporus, Strain RCC1130" /LENGTH=222 /DNA_ID=CAMNT_0007424125 /DNA_START=203 /DNA_END=873 /DNA_ORIENTATION=-
MQPSEGKVGLVETGLYDPLDLALKAAALAQFGARRVERVGNGIGIERMQSSKERTHLRLLDFLVVENGKHLDSAVRQVTENSQFDDGEEHPEVHIELAARSAPHCRNRVLLRIHFLFDMVEGRMHDEVECLAPARQLIVRAVAARVELTDVQRVVLLAEKSEANDAHAFARSKRVQGKSEPPCAAGLRSQMKADLALKAAALAQFGARRVERVGNGIGIERM